MSLRRHFGQPCPYCGKPMVRAAHGNRRVPTRDHRVPTCRGGLDVRLNIVVCCRDCNEIKGPLDEEEFAAWKRGDASRLDRAPRGPTGRKMRVTIAAYPPVPYVHHTRTRARYCHVTAACLATEIGG